MKHLLATPLLLVLATTPVWAQNQNQPTRPVAPTGIPADGVNGVISQAERSQNADALLLAYGQAVTDPTLARLAIGQLLSNFYSLRNQAQTPDQANQAINEASLRFQVLQAAQNQVLIQQNQQILQQNQQIIALLQRGQGVAPTR